MFTADAGSSCTSQEGQRHDRCRRAAEQGDEADEAFGGTNPRAASGAQPEVPPNARAAAAARGHRFAAYPRCCADRRVAGMSELRRRIIRAFGVLVFAVLVVSTVAEDRPVLRLAFGLAVVGTLGTLLGLARLRRRPSRRLGLGMAALLVASLAGLLAATLGFGGGALNGRTTDGRCYLNAHGVETEVSCSVYEFVAGLEVFYFVTWLAAGAAGWWAIGSRDRAAAYGIDVERGRTTRG
jgi:hypothetical protein